MSTFSSPCTDHDRCTLDLARLLAAIAEVAAVIRTLKKTPRTKEEGPPPLRPHRARATLLCALRAHHRGHLHASRVRGPDGTIRAVTLDEQAKLVEETAREFVKA